MKKKKDKKLKVEYIYQPSHDAENRLHRALKMLIKEEDLYKNDKSEYN